MTPAVPKRVSMPLVAAGQSIACAASNAATSRSLVHIRRFLINLGICQSLFILAFHVFSVEHNQKML
jgi:hypothetical protein